MKSGWKALLFIVTAPLMLTSAVAQQHSLAAATTVLDPTRYHQYIELFQAQEREASGKTGDDPWPWIVAHIPWFESSDKGFEQIYYFRWYAWQKHVAATPRGFVVTEWLPKAEAQDGFFGALPDAAAFHLGEARWLRNRRIAEDDARYWMSSDADPRKYSFWAADSVLAITLATGDRRLATQLLPALEANYHAWEASNRDSNGLFWQVDTRDGMEKSISGDGYRPTLNSYMYGEAVAISALAAATDDRAVQKDFGAKAAALRQLVEQKLWNPRDEFYESVSPALDSGIRNQKKFVDPGTTLAFSGVRELVGYIPWQFNLPAPEHAVAWKQLFDPLGFAGKYGPTTAERRSPRFRFASSDQCTWNGPSWPYATTQTLLALANLLDTQKQSYVGPKDYYKLFAAYVLSQHLKLSNGHVIPWIDEDLDADTDEWIAKDMLLAKNKQVGRGNYYNHSGFADPLITGLIGLRARMDDRVVVHPLLPAGVWTYFALDGLPYHGHLLTILYDETGKQYRRGRGTTLFIDGKKCASRVDLGPLECRLLN